MNPVALNVVRGGFRSVRIVVLINFVLMAALLGPLKNHNIYSALRSAGLAAPVVLVLQLWIVGSTLFATAVFIRGSAKQSDATDQGLGKGPMLDGALLLAWWIVLVLACLYAFAIGMAV